MSHLARTIVVIALALLVASLEAAERNTGPWEVKRLAEPPKAEWGEQQGLLQPVYFAGEPYHGQPTRVFAWYARPQGEGPFPAMVLLHGGGGKAFPEWAKLWAERGYAALAIDLAGHGPDGKRLADGGPEQDDKTKFANFDDASLRDMWTYHAVADALLGHSLLASRQEVDRDRIGVTGISWGGYLTCIVAGVDARLKCAVPVYGCGFLHEDSYWVEGSFNKMEAAQRARWVKHFDPSSYLAGVSCPIFFVNGTNDFAYPLDSYRRSYELVDQNLVTLRVTVNMPHGHQQGWAPPEIGLFVDSVLKQGAPLPRAVPPRAKAGYVSAFETKVPLKSAEFHYTLDGGPWQKRKWATVKAELADNQVSVTPPAELTDHSGHATYFFTVRDERGAIVSSAHVARVPAEAK
jgi:dienelactone hydrolase